MALGNFLRTDKTITNPIREVKQLTQVEINVLCLSGDFYKLTKDGDSSRAELISQHEFLREKAKIKYRNDNKDKDYKENKGETQSDVHTEEKP